MSKKRILQMMAADGWYARFAPKDGSKFSLKLICWVLVEEDGATMVEGMYSDGGYSQFCEGSAEFDDYIHVGAVILD